MTIKSKLDIKGFEEYLEKIAQAGRNIDQVAKEALTAGGNVLVDGMLRRAPEETGLLKSHIKVSAPAQDGNFNYVKVGVVFDVDRTQEMYFFYQEMGTSSMAAHPYIRPAMDEDMKIARKAMLDVFKARSIL